MGSKKKPGGKTVIEGIQANSVRADVLAVGRQARAEKTVIEAGADTPATEGPGQEPRSAPDPALPEFSRVETEFVRLKAQFERGILTEQEFKSRLDELMIEDNQGRWWILGYQTGLWYYHDGEKWVQSEPPGGAQDS
jgi:hypothetical protein